MPAYVCDKDLKTFAAPIIQAHRPELSILNIQFMFRPEASVSGDRVTAGMCIKVDDRNWSIHRHDFIIEIAKDLWEEATNEFRTALMDHELGHCGIRMDEDGKTPMIDEKSGRIKTYCKPHTIEEFEEVLERHGPYHGALRKFLDAFGKNKSAKKTKADADVDVSAELGSDGDVSL